MLKSRCLALISLAAFASETFAVLRCRISAYRMAQLLNARPHLADPLSTGIYYATPHPLRACDEGTPRRQAEQAMRLLKRSACDAHCRCDSRSLSG